MLNRRLIGRATKIALAVAAMVSMTANAATQAEINTAIDNGLAYLASPAQQSGGVWSSLGYTEAHTGAAVFAMLTQQSQWKSNTAAYQAIVDGGVNYLLQHASTMTVSTRNDGASICPGSGTCNGVYWAGEGEATYTTGQVAMSLVEYAKTKGPGTIATTTGPLAGMTWTQIAQGVINAYSASQSSALNGNRDGGWRYYIPGNGDSDMSTTQWAVLASIYGQSIGAIVPTTVKDHLNTWLTNVQAGDGSACYQPGIGPCEQADTGGLLLSLNFLGKAKTDPAVQAALGFLNSNWKQGAYGTWYGNFGQPYAMWAEYKGLELTLGLNDTTTITNLLSSCGGDSPTACNWWQDYNEWLVNNQQQGDGSWGGYGYWDTTLATAYDLPILGGAEVPPPPSIPEPATIALVGLALAGLGVSRRRAG